MDADTVAEKIVSHTSAIACPTNTNKTEKVGGKQLEEGAETEDKKKDNKAGSKPSVKEGTSSTVPNSPAIDQNGAAPQNAPFDPAKAIQQAMAKLDIDAGTKPVFPKAMPVIKMNLKYKPMEHLTKVRHFLKHIPTVYSDAYPALHFDFADQDYEINQIDIDFLKDLNEKLKSGQITIKQEPLTEKEFERFIDAADKVY